MSAPEQTPIIQISPTFQPYGQRIKGERERRLIDAKKTLSFGVRFLDAAFGGIFLRDNVLLGAATGTGKTTLASVIAETNAEAGKHVHYFALECEEGEIERRIKFRVLSQLVHKHAVARMHAGRFNYLDWYNGKLDAMTGKWEAEADRLLSERYKTLHTYYRLRDFTAEDLEKTFLAIQDETDLIILDHIHMVDHDDDSENRGMKNIVKRLRDTALEVGKPTVVVAHLRKRDGRSKSIIPSIDDFHGTSDIAKICTKAILLAPAFDQENPAANLWQTYIHPAKCRSEGSRTRYIGLVPFNVHTGRYENDFDIGPYEYGMDQFTYLTRDDKRFPAWAMVDE